jgi:hypothetical protein
MRVAFLAIALVMFVGVLTVVWSTPRNDVIEIRHVGGLPVECLSGTAEAFPFAVVRCGKPVAPPEQPSIDEGRQPYGPHERSRPIVRV